MASRSLPALLPSGSTCSAAILAPLAAALPSQRAMTVRGLAPPGVGGAARPFAALVAEHLAAAPERFHLIAYCAAGFAAIAMASEAPQRVASLGLIGSTVRADAPAEAAARRRLIAMAETPGAERPMRLFLARDLARMAAPGRRLAVRPALRRLAQDLGVDDIIAQQRALLDRPDLRAALGGLSSPVLIAYGSDSPRAVVLGGEEIAAIAPEAALHRIPECGHLGPIEQPAALAALLGPQMVRAEKRFGAGPPLG